MAGRTLAIIQCRLGSARFPKKALADLAGEPLIRHVVKRVFGVAGLDRVVVAVPNAADKAALLSVCRDLAAEFWCDHSISESDVLGRFAKCAEGSDIVLRATADCPLWNPRIAEHVLALYHANPHIDYASNIAEGYVDGEDVEVFSAKALKLAARLATDAADREHVTPWLRRNVACATLIPSSTEPKPKTSVDTIEDLERVRALIKTGDCGSPTQVR